MTTSATERLRSQLERVGDGTVLVRGTTARPRPPETVTVAPGATVGVKPDCRRGLLYVTAEAPSGRTVRRYDGTDFPAAVECAADLATERDPQAVWLCDRERVVSLWGEEFAVLLERRLGTVAHEADARLVVWTTESDVAAEDRYDVVLDA